GATPVRTAGLRPSPQDPRVPPRARSPRGPRRRLVFRSRRPRPRDRSGGARRRLARREGLARPRPLEAGLGFVAHGLAPAGSAAAGAAPDRLAARPRRAGGAYGGGVAPPRPRGPPP